MELRERSSLSRSAVLASQGIVATAHPLANAAGLHVLQQGGNAMDAAVAIAGVLGVVQPMMSGIGGDTFLLWYDAHTRQVSALNGSGAAPRGADRTFFASRGYTTMPFYGMLSPSVPGAVDAMATALERWGSGRFKLGTLLEPAIHYAEEGAPVHKHVARWLRESAAIFERFPSTARIFAPSGRPLEQGELCIQRDLGASLRLIALHGREAFYDGPLGEKIVAYAQAHGGLLTRDDMRGHRSALEPPLAATYRDLTVYTTPPPSQGIILLMMLNILEGVDRETLRWGDPEGIHMMVEAKKRTFADRVAHLGDPRFVGNPIERLLSKAHAAAHRESIRGGTPVAGVPANGGEDTTYFAVADSSGNLVSLITSLSAKFGCGEVIEGTGILLNNRAGRGFSLQEGHPNVIAPGKRTMHTLMPFMAFQNGVPRYVFGTPGGDGQPQWNLQVILNLVESGMDVQEAIEAPRWLHFPGTDPANISQPFELRMERGFPEQVYPTLEARGHHVIRRMHTEEGGGVQVIAIDQGIYRAGSDPRVDGLAIGY